MSEPPPWTHPLRWTDIQRGLAERPLIADESARAGIARLLCLEALPRLEARYSLKPWMDGVELTGRIQALATRLCGVSLEPFDELVDAPMTIRVVPPGSQHLPGAQARQVQVDLDGEDPPDVLEGDTLDVAAYVIEHLALALAPFPRKPGAVFEAPHPAADLSPFSVLRDLQSRN